MIGVRNGKQFKVVCKNSATLAEASRPDPATEWINLKNNVGAAAKLLDKKNAKIMAATNYQTGWWTRDADDTDGTTNAKTKWTWTVKPKRNVCPADGCRPVAGVATCCVNFPDANNLQCKAKTLDGVTQSDTAHKPMLAFIPKCTEKPANTAPASAKDDSSKEAGSKAAENLTKFNASLEETAKTKDKYSAMDATKKATWDAAWKKKVTARETADAADKTAAGYATMATVAKTVYDAELYKWKTAVHATCKTNDKDFKCTEARKIRTKIEANRKTTKYYSEDTTKRAKLDEAEKATTKKSEDEVKAAWVKDVKKGELGFDCTKETATAALCVATKQCCGTATPKANKAGDTKGQRKVCNTAALTTFKDKGTAEFTFKCGATQLIASAGAVLAAAYLM